MKTLLLACWWVLLVCGAALAQPAPQDPAALRPRAKLSPAELDKLLTQLKDFDILGPPPMQVRIVRSDAAGCEPNCPEWISAQGRIVADTLPRFKAVLQSLGTRKLPILIDSNGGAVHEALAIGRLIRARGLDVAVALTRLSPCPPDQPRCRFNAKPTQPFPGRPVGPFAKCASSCAFILAAGTHRYVGRLTRVGVHQVTSSQTYAKVLRRYKIVQQPGLFGPAKQTKQLISEEKLSEKTVETQTGDATYAKIKAYFAEMGIADAIVAILMTTLPTDIHWLTPAELADTRMVTDQKDGEELITGVVRPAPNPTAGFNPARPSATPLFQQGCAAFGGAAAGCIFAGLPAKPNTPPPPVPAPLAPATAPVPPQPAESVPAPVAPNATSTPPTRAAAIEVKPAADTPQAPVTAPAIEDPKAVALALQQGLKSAGCYSGDADGRWGDKSSRALSDFAAHARMTLYSLEPTKAALTAVQSKAGVICPVTCVGGETKVDGRCRPIAAALEKPRPAATPASPVPQQVSTPDCACPQMRTCTGSWKTMSCADLKYLCRTTNDAGVYARNGCTKLKQVVGF